MRTRLLAFWVVVATALTLPQAAPAQTVPDERAAAQEFAYAAYRLRLGIKAEGPAMRGAVAFLKGPRCQAELFDLLENLDERPRRTMAGIAVAMNELEFGAQYGVAGGQFATFAAELDKVQTADPALVAGRENWRGGAQLLGQVRPLARDTCTQLRRWRLTEYAFDRAPALQPEPLHALFVEGVLSRLRGEETKPDRRLDRAIERMVELGVPEGQAERFGGSTVFRGIDLRVYEITGGDATHG
jgi:hypothetical protein